MFSPFARFHFEHEIDSVSNSSKLDIVITLIDVVYSHHNAPRELGPGTLDVQIIGQPLMDDGLITIAWVCYGCNNWTGTGFDNSQIAQPLIYAANHDQLAVTSDSGKTLYRHDEYGMQNPNFFGSADRILTISGVFMLDAQSPSPTESHDNVLVTPLWQLNAAQMHGILMGGSFGTILPLGVAAVLFKSSKSFVTHWMTQICFSSMVLIAAFPVIPHAWSSSHVSSHSYSTSSTRDMLTPSIDDSSRWRP